MKIAIVIAAYNEIGNITPLTERLLQTLDMLPGTSWKLIYVIDGTDGTVEVARQFARRTSKVEILYSEKPSGLGQAFRRGFAAVPTDTDAVVTMDADLNHRPEEIPRLVQSLITKNADIVVGSRRMEESSVEKAPFWKRSLSGMGNRLMHVCMGVRINDLTSGFRVYRGAALRQIKFESDGFAFLPEILIQATERQLTIIEEPIQFVCRTSGESKMYIGPTLSSYFHLFLRHLQTGFIRRGPRKSSSPVE
jgi:dolichol-phosphate mannosyltransferase